MSEDTKFSVMASLFEWIQKSKYSGKKRSKFRKFLDTFCNPRDYFSAIRLVLPSLDRERGSYGLKESVLANCLVDALGISKDSPDALRLFNWRKSNTASNAGNFPLVAAEVLQRRQGTASGGLTIKELNELLDQLASSENRAEKSSILSVLIQKTNAKEMKWIIMIILKDLKLGISEKSIFHEFHLDAEDLFNVTCDLKLVCEKLRDRSQRHKRQDIEVGKAVRPQLAMRVSDIHAAWKKLHGKEVVADCKFDGDRIQIHKNGSEIHYFSRNFFDHSEYEHGMSDVIIQNVLADRCILDGEMLVWDTSLNRFAEFGSNQEIAKAAKEGLDSDRQLCYVAFDVLYVGDTSVIHQSLKERHELLRKVVKPVKGQLEVLLPNGSLNAHCPAGDPCWSIIAHTLDDVEKFFKETIENRDEGIVLKDLGSKWEPSDRSGKWLKLKPEYVRAGSDLDVLIIGGYYGSGRRGGEVAQFLVGLAERPAPNTYPRRFISFCRVGTGLSDDELDAVVTKLKPYFRKNEYPKKVPPSFYQLTNHSKERPDVWIESPEKSIVLSITSDIRTIRSEVFAAPYSLRFPRIDRVRYEKPWHECLDVQSFVELVHSGNGTMQKGNDHGELQDSKYTHRKSSRKGDKKSISVVPSHFILTDVSNIKGETSIFLNMMFYFVNLPRNCSLETLHKMVVENGGAFSMNLNNSVTHCVAAEGKGIKYQAAKLHGDVIHYSWVVDCCSQKKLLPLQPKYFIFLSESSKTKLQEEIDQFSDSYYHDLDLVDIKHLLNHMNPSADSVRTKHMKRKYCPRGKWCLFNGCCIYFHIAEVSLTPDWASVLSFTLRRLNLEVLSGGGEVSNNLLHATHLVILSAPGSEVNLDILVKSLGSAVKRLLRNKKLSIVAFQWLEDSVVRKQRLEEQMYTLKSSGHEDSDMWFENVDDGSSDSIVEVRCKLPSEERDNKAVSEDSKELSSTKNEFKRKRGRPADRSTKKGKISADQARKTWARTAQRHGKICDDQLDNSDSRSDYIIEERAEFSQSADRSTKKRKIGVGRARITRARTGQKPAKIDDESDDGNSHSDNGIEGRVESSRRVVNEEDLKLEQKDMAKELELRHSNKDDGEEDDSKQDARSGEAPNVKRGQEYNVESKQQEKLEVLVDPVHAMLMDMIPSLGKEKAEEQDMKFIGKRVEAVDLPTNNGMTAEDVDDVTNLQPVKKKKVSYKDLANKLLQS